MSTYHMNAQGKLVPTNETLPPIGSVWKYNGPYERQGKSFTVVSTDRVAILAELEPYEAEPRAFIASDAFAFCQDSIRPVWLPSDLPAPDAATLASWAMEYRRREEERKRKIEQEREEADRLLERGKAIASRLIPADCPAVIVAELRQDESDLHTDYFGHRTVRRVVLATSRHKRDLFPELRKAAARLPETADLATAPAEWENREKYSMGGGYYLGKSRHSGWIIKKTILCDDLIRSLAIGHCLDVPQAPTQAPTQTPTQTPTKTPTQTRTGARVEKHRHTRKGWDMWIVVIDDRLPREEWERLTQAAKATGGWYSRAWGRTPGGWAWKSEAPALAFLAAHFPGGDRGPDGQPDQEQPAQEPQECGTCIPDSCDIGTCPAPSLDGRGDRYRAMADRFQAEAERKRAPRLENTPKRRREAGSARVDADRAERAASYARAYADALDAGTLPSVLLRFPAPSKQTFLNAARQTLMGERGYYDPPVESGEWALMEAEAIALRVLTDQAKTEADREREAANAKESQKRTALAKLRGLDADGFFPTPPKLAAQVAGIVAEHLTGRESPRILEPSAGIGSLVEAVQSAIPQAKVHAIEIRADLCAFLREHIKPSLGVGHYDFLSSLPGDKYDAIVMNPPYERLKGVGYLAPVHVHHALRWLRDDGILVAVVPLGMMETQGKYLPNDCDLHGWTWEETPNDPHAFADRMESFRVTSIKTATLTIKKG